MTKLIGKVQAMRQLTPDDYSSEFERHYEYYRQRIERRLVKQVYDKRRFDDICQDTFERALTYFARQDAKLPQTDYHLGNMLCIMAVQVAIDDYRKNKKSKDYMYLSDSNACAQLLELIDEGYEDRICDRDSLQKAIAQLTPLLRVIVLLMLQGFKQKDIAVKLGFSEPTVSGYVRLARAELCKKYFSSIEPLDSTVLLVEVVALLGRKDYQVRVHAFEMFYEYYQKPIERSLERLVHNQEHARDLRQVTFMRVWKLFKRLDAKLPQNVNHLINLLYKIAYYVAIDDYRKKRG